MSLPHIARSWNAFGPFRRRPATTAYEGDTPADEDERLLRAGLAGEERAMATLLARHESALLRLAYALLGSVADAEDAVQEAFLRALRALAGRGEARFRGDASVKTWLHRITVNVCLEMRRKRRHATISFDDLPLGGEEVAAPHASPEQTTLDRALLRSAFAALPPELRAAVALREWEGWSVAEIATTMGWSEKKAHNELYRARRALLKWRQANHAALTP